MGVICRVSEVVERLPDELKGTAGSECIIYTINLHTLQEALASDGLFSDVDMRSRDATQSLQDFLEELAEVGMRFMGSIQSSFKEYTGQTPPVGV